VQQLARTCIGNRLVEVSFNGERHEPVNLVALASGYLLDEEEVDEEADIRPLQWDPDSIALCGSEIAGLWQHFGLEHDLPSDFASVWEAMFGGDFRSAVVDQTDDTRKVEVPKQPYRSHRTGSGGNWGGGGGVEAGYFYGLAGGMAASGDWGGGDSGGGGD
jgi:hypothetical protein